MPYPTGYKRDAENCVIDRPWFKYDDNALMPRNTGLSNDRLGSPART